MKLKIIIGLTVTALVFLFAGLYILFIIDSTTAKLDNLIMLHQVEILREHYLIQIRRVQTDLTVGETKFARDFDTVISHVSSMERVVNTCFDCHHVPAVEERLRDLRDHTRRYESGLSRVLTYRASNERVAAEREAAFQVGESLIEKVSDMITMTGAKLENSTQKALEQIRKTKQILFVLLAAGPISSVALGFLLIKGLSQPLESLLAATRRIKAGDLDHRVTGLKEEFAELGAAFNEMSASIKEHMTTRERAERMAMLGQVSAGLAHEIKNPLAGIKAAMDVLTMEPSVAEEDKEVLRKVRQEVGRVEALMKTFLNFARPPKPQPANVDINALLSSCVGLYGRGPARAKSDAVDVVTDLNPLPVVLTDPMQLEQVVINLLLNAFDAMPAGGTLTVRSEHDVPAHMVHIRVGDTGRGIIPDNLEKIFEPFFTTKPRGTGLGLAISRQLIEQQGGSLSVHSSPGNGTTFTISLRVAAERVEAAE